MKILHITTQKPFQTGSGTYLLGLVKGLTDLGHTNKIICGISSNDDFNEIRDCTKAEIVPVLYESEEIPFPVLGMSNVMPYKSTRYSDLTESMALAVKETFLNKIKETVNEFKPDVIICQHLYLLTAYVREYFRNIPVFGVCHGSDLRQINTNNFKREYIKNQIYQLDGIFSLHCLMSEEIKEVFNCKDDTIHTTGTGFSEEIFMNSDSKNNKNKFYKINDKSITPTGVNMVFTGKLSNSKGVPELIEAVNLLNNKEEIKDTYCISLTLIGGSGDDDEFESIKKLVRESEVEIVMTGILPQNEIADIYRKSDIFVLPSFYEGLPLVIPEALSCGLIAVTNNLPYIKDWKEEFKDHIVTTDVPALVNHDQIDPMLRDKYIENLSKSLEEAIERLYDHKIVDISKMSWKGLAGRISDIIEGLV